MRQGSHRYNGKYTGCHLDHVAFPLGGIGAGMICLEGTGALSHVSLRHRPEIYHQPLLFSALWIKGAPTARVLEGPVPPRKIFGPPGTGNGGRDTTYGLPHFRDAAFQARFPFATVELADPDMPVDVQIAGWSPFTPGNSDDSCLPVAALEFAFKNTLKNENVQGVYSFHSRNFLACKTSSGSRVEPLPGGIALHQPSLENQPWQEATLRAWMPGVDANSDCGWFRGGWFDSFTMLWEKVQSGNADAVPPHAAGDPSPGASIYVPFSIEPAETTRMRLLVSWYVPHSDLRVGPELDNAAEADSQRTYAPWYAGAFDSAAAVAAHWERHLQDLRDRSKSFSDALYDTTLPDEVIEAVAANLTILKSPTCLRQKDGRFWGWEGCCDAGGCCPGSCTHVWNYAQALPHLFPDLERSLRETEFNESQNEAGHQAFRATLPIRPTTHQGHAASDGQLGGIMKAYREWRISGNSEWLRRLWPKIRQSLEYCIKTWDPQRLGVLQEPHHNTYDIEFWGPDPMCTSFYLGALKAAATMGQALQEPVQEYRNLYDRGREYLETKLFNGEYFLQTIQWQGLQTKHPADDEQTPESYSPEAEKLLQKEGPKYQYGEGCLSDGILGAWIAAVCGLTDDLIDAAKTRSHLCAVHRYNLRTDLSNHSNTQRPTYATGEEGGLLLCSWPRGNKLSLPFVYSNEVWTGIEYQVAAHLMLVGCTEQGLHIVRTCRNRYDGTVRNPFNEYECGHWYARAMSSYAMLQCLTGARYDAVTRTLHLAPRINGDFRALLCTEKGYGTVGVRKGRPFLNVRSGTIPVERIEYTPATGDGSRRATE